MPPMFRYLILQNKRTNDEITSTNFIKKNVNFLTLVFCKSTIIIESKPTNLSTSSGYVTEYLE